MMVKENLAGVEARIRAACKRCGRDEDSVTLISVSKTKPVRLIEEAYEYGKRDFGENKAQEMKQKYEVLPDDIRWHFIGHLQTNKIKYVVGHACLIHSVDSLHLAQGIEAESAKRDLVTHILLEVNVAGEKSKFGVTPEYVFELAEKISKFPHVRIDGLMTVAPYVSDADKNRPVFRRLNTLSVDIAGKNIDNVSMDILSMGMTGDYEAAIEEGATHIRVGTGIFGERDYNI